MLWLHPEPKQDALYLKFQKNQLVWCTEHFSEYGYIDLAVDGSPIGIAVLRAYSEKHMWPIDENVIDKYRLQQWADDIRTVCMAHVKDRLPKPTVLRS